MREEATDYYKLRRTEPHPERLGYQAMDGEPAEAEAAAAPEAEAAPAAEGVPPAEAATAEAAEAEGLNCTSTATASLLL